MAQKRNPYTSAIVLITLLAIFNVFDGLSTVFFIEYHDATELNPLMAWLYDHDPVYFLTVKLAYTALVVFLVWMNRSRNEILSTAMIVTAIYGMLFLYQIGMVVAVNIAR